MLRDIFEADESVNEISVAAKEEVAFHEAGHAVAALAFDPEGVGLISIRPSKSDARGVVQIFKSEDYFGSYNKMHERVISLLAGRAAVELKFGHTDVGATSDIERAAFIAERFVTDYGMSGFELLRPDNRTLTAEGHDERVVVGRNAMLARCYEEAKDVLRRNWAFVEKLAAALVERDTLVFEEIAELRKEMAA